jgi:hypothetical protein
MTIQELAPLIVPAASAIAILIPTIGNRRTIIRRLDEIDRSVQMLTMHDESLPLSERVQAGKRYIELKGNGAGEAYYKILSEKYAEKVEQHMGGKP